MCKLTRSLRGGLQEESFLRRIAAFSQAKISFPWQRITACLAWRKIALAAMLFADWREPRFYSWMTLLDVPEKVRAEDLGRNGIIKLNV
jgi:hypothetical protein